MGRQAALMTRVLGRSPYERLQASDLQDFEARQLPPSRQDSGIHVQRYDHKAQPENLQSKAAARQLRRAQNDVLYSVGVVGKNDEQHRVDEAMQENTYGLLLHVLIPSLTVASGWWVSSLRARYQTYEDYSLIPLAYVQRIERSRLGFFAFYFAGLPFSVLAWVLNPWYNPFLRELVEFITVTDHPTLENKYRQAGWMKQLRRMNRFTNIVFLTCSIPLRIFSTLQILQIVPAMALPSLVSLLPLRHSWMFRIQPMSDVKSFSDFLRFSYELCMSPFCLTLAYEAAQYNIGNRLFSIFRKIIPKPDKPDQISLRAAFEENYDESDIPGLNTAEKANSSATALFLGDIAVDFPAATQRIRAWYARILNLDAISRHEAQSLAQAALTGRVSSSSLSRLPEWLQEGHHPVTRRARIREISALPVDDLRRQYCQDLEYLCDHSKELVEAINPQIESEYINSSASDDFLKCFNRMLDHINSYTTRDIVSSDIPELQVRLDDWDKCITEVRAIVCPRTTPGTDPGDHQVSQPSLGPLIPDLNLTVPYNPPSQLTRLQQRGAPVRRNMSFRHREIERLPANDDRREDFVFFSALYEDARKVADIISRYGERLGINESQNEAVSICLLRLSAEIGMYEWGNIYALSKPSLLERVDRMNNLLSELRSFVPPRVTTNIQESTSISRDNRDVRSQEIAAIPAHEPVRREYLRNLSYMYDHIILLIKMIDQRLETDRIQRPRDGTIHALILEVAHIEANEYVSNDLNSLEDYDLWRKIVDFDICIEDLHYFIVSRTSAADQERNESHDSSDVLPHSSPNEDDELIPTYVPPQAVDNNALLRRSFNQLPPRPSPSITASTGSDDGDQPTSTYRSSDPETPQQTWSEHIDSQDRTLSTGVGTTTIEEPSSRLSPHGGIPPPSPGAAVDGPGQERNSTMLQSRNRDTGEVVRLNFPSISSSHHERPPPPVPPQPQQPLSSYNPHHRVTLLSNFPADTLAAHASSLLTTLMLLPLESLVMRSIALSYPNPPFDMGVRSVWCWFGGRQGGLGDRLGYMLSVGLLLGMQTVTYNAVWRFGNIWAKGFGRSLGWGKL